MRRYATGSIGDEQMAGRWRRTVCTGIAALVTVAATAGVAPTVAWADGEPDVTFGTGGVLVGDFHDALPNVTLSGLSDVVRDRAGRWIAAGTLVSSSGGSPTGGVLARWLPDGRLDSTFGTRGYVLKVGNLDRFTPTALAVLADGDLAVATENYLVRLDQVGSLTKLWSFDPPVFLPLARRLVVLADGRLLVPGVEPRVVGGVSEFAAAGRVVDPDVEPGDPPLRLAALAGAPPVNDPSAAVDATGRMFIGGCSHLAPAPDCSINAYRPDGSVDSSFGADGVLRLTVGGASAQSCSFDVAPDGFVATACSSTFGEVTVAQYTPDGQPDPGFIVTKLPTHGFEEAYATVRVEGTGRLLVSVADPATPFQTEAVVRAYEPDGATDVSFGTGGVTRVKSSSLGTGMSVDELYGVAVWGMPQSREGTTFWIASVVAPDGPALQPPLVATSAFTPVTPARLLDTRVGIGAPAVKPGAGATVVLQVAGAGPVPAAGVTAVVLNVTATEAAAPGFVTVWPTGIVRPVASNLNLTDRGETNANLVVVPLGDGGAVSLYTLAGTHLVADVAGWFTEAAEARAGRLQTASAPFRVLDTRDGIGVPAGLPRGGATVDVRIAGVGEVPASGVSAVVLNVTGTEAIADGYVTAWPTGSGRPTASALNLERGGTRANLVIVPVGADGSISLYTQSGTHLVADVTGWFTGDSAAVASSGLFVAIPPRRMLDTRITPGIVPADATATRVVGGTRVVPGASASAIVANVTATDASAAGYVTAMPAGSTRPSTSTLNLPARGSTVPNAAVIGLGDDAVALYTQSGTHLIMDVSGWFVA